MHHHIQQLLNRGTITRGLALVSFALRLVWDLSPWRMLSIALLSVACALLPLLNLWVMGRLVDVSLDLLPLISANPWDGLRHLAPWLGAFALTLMLARLAQSASDYLSYGLSLQLRARVSQLVQCQMADIPFQVVQSPTFRRQTYRALQSSPDKPIYIFFSALTLLRSALTFCALAIWLGALAWWLPLLVMAAGAPLVMARLWTSGKSFQLYESQADEERRLNYYHRVLTSPIFGPEVRLFNLFPFFRTRFDAMHQTIFQQSMDVSRMGTMRTAWSTVLTVILSTLAFAAVVVYAGIVGVSVGALATYLLAMRRAEAAVTDVGHSTIALHSNTLYISILHRFLSGHFLSSEVPCGQIQSQTQSQSQTPVLETDPSSFPTQFDAIRVCNVSFRYPNSERMALSNISLSIPRGQVIGLTGRNGSGKSTLTKMLCGLLTPNSGHILIGNTDLASIPEHELCGHVTAVFQDFRVYCVTARENIMMGDLTRQDPQALQWAAQMVGLHDLIMRLPQAYDTRLGDEFEGSEMFSRGEWQLMAIARVLYSRAEIVFLDEPTSSLDPKARAKLRECVDILHAQGRTVIVVSHIAETLKGLETIEVGE